MSLARGIPDILRPGFPAPANARLSLGLEPGVLTPTCQNHPTSTIKLISKPFSNTNFNSGAVKNGKPQLQPFETKSVLVNDPKSGKRARKDSDSQLLARLISYPNVDISYGAGENGAPQLQPFETKSVFVDDPKSGKRTRKDSDGQLMARLISYPNVDLSYGAGENGAPQQLQPFKKRARMDSKGVPKKSDQEIRLERAQEAIRKKLEANRARRRSSAAHGRRKSGVISTGRPIPLGETAFLFYSSSSAYNVGFHYQVNLNPSLLALGFCHLPNHLFKVCGIVESFLHLLLPAIYPSLQARM